jgi:hypothetical protein
MTDEWREKLYAKGRQYIHQFIEEQDVVYEGAIYDFWRAKGKLLIGEAEFLGSEAEETGRKDALLELKQAIEADGNINNDSPNTGRVMQLIDTFVAETEVEVDYSNDEDGETLEEDS